MFPFSPEEYFKNPKETISKLKEDYHKLEEANSGKFVFIRLQEKAK